MIFYTLAFDQLDHTNSFSSPMIWIKIQNTFAETRLGADQ